MMTEQWRDGGDTFPSGEPVDPVGALLWRAGNAVAAWCRSRRRTRGT